MWSLDEIGNTVDDYIGAHKLFGPAYDWTSTLGKPLLFVLGTSAAAFAGAAIWRYEVNRKQWTALSTSRQQRRQNFMSMRDLHAAEDSQPGDIASAAHNNVYWHSASNVLVGLIVINGIIYVAWHIPQWTPLMARYFISHTSRPPFAITLLLSPFSHRQPVDFLTNMLGVVYFGNSMLKTHDRINRAETVAGNATYPPFHVDKFNLIAFCVSAGVVSAWTSRAIRIALNIESSPMVLLGASGIASAAFAASTQLNMRLHTTLSSLNEDLLSKVGLLFGFIGGVLGICSKQPWYADFAGQFGGFLFGSWFASSSARHAIHKYQSAVTKLWIKLRTGNVDKSSSLLAGGIVVAIVAMSGYAYYRHCSSNNYFSTTRAVALSSPTGSISQHSSPQELFSAIERMMHNAVGTVKEAAQGAFKLS